MFSFAKEDTGSKIVIAAQKNRIIAFCTETGEWVNIGSSLGPDDVPWGFGQSRYSVFMSNSAKARKFGKILSGTCTSTSTTQLIDSTATFTGSVNPYPITVNDIVINSTNGAVYRITAVAATTLTLTQMESAQFGFNQFTSGDGYQICRLTRWGILAPAASLNISLTPVTSQSVAGNATSGATTDLDATNTKLAQGFFLRSSVGTLAASIGSVKVNLTKLGGGPDAGNLNIRIETDLLGLPSGELVTASAVSQAVTVASVGAGPADVTFTFASPVALQENVQYWIVLIADSAYVPATRRVSWTRSTTPSAYPTVTPPSTITSNNLRMAKFSSSAWAAIVDGGTGLETDAVFSVLGVSRFIDGGRSYRVSWFNSVSGHISNPSAPSPYTGNVISQATQIGLSEFLSPNDSQVDKMIIWATTDGGAIYYYLDEVAITVATYNDTKSDDDLDFTREVSYDNFSPDGAFPGSIVIRFKDAFLIAGNTSDPRRVAVTAAPDQILSGQGVPQECLPLGNYLTLPTGGERISGGIELDDVKLLFSTHNYVAVDGDRPGRFSLNQDVGGHAPIGSRSPMSIQVTAHGVILLTSDRRVMLIPTWDRIPVDISGIIRDNLELIDHTYLGEVRSGYFSFEPYHFYAISFLNSSGVNELWLYNLDLHALHPGLAWIGPISFRDIPSTIVTSGKPFTIGSMCTHTDRTKKKLFLLGSYGIVRHFAPTAATGSPAIDARYSDVNEDQTNSLTSTIKGIYSSPLMDDSEPDINKDLLEFEYGIPGQLAIKFSISGSTLATPSVVTSSSPHGLNIWVSGDGQPVYISGHLGNTAINGFFFAKVLTSTTFSLYQDKALTQPVAGSGAGTASGNFIVVPLIEFSLDSESSYEVMPIFAAVDPSGSDYGSYGHRFRSTPYRQFIRVKLRVTVPETNTEYPIHYLRLGYEPIERLEGLHAS
jgi:hypothetical protein